MRMRAVRQHRPLVLGIGLPPRVLILEMRCLMNSSEMRKENRRGVRKERRRNARKMMMLMMKMPMDPRRYRPRL
jgi:hypothetical protein